MHLSAFCSILSRSTSGVHGSESAGLCTRSLERSTVHPPVVPHQLPAQSERARPYGRRRRIQIVEALFEGEEMRGARKRERERKTFPDSFGRAVRLYRSA